MSRTIQSENYVPGVSGWKFNALTGDYEINSSNIAVGSLPTDPQPITITAGEWSDPDLPANALERYAFIGAELMKIPTEFRDSTEFTTEDFSFDRDGSDYRTTLTYVRQETQEEAKARQEKAKVAGTWEVFRALKATIDGFEAEIRRLDRLGLRFAIFRNRKNTGPDQFGMGGTKEVRIVPVVEGSKRGGILQIVLGVVLIAASYFGAPTAPAGIALLAGGVIQMLSPQVVPFLRRLQSCALLIFRRASAEIYKSKPLSLRGSGA